MTHPVVVYWHVYGFSGLTYYLCGLALLGLAASVRVGVYVAAYRKGAERPTTAPTETEGDFS